MGKLSETRFGEMLSYSEQQLQSLAQDQIWKGKGTEFDPFVVENANILVQAIVLKKSSLYISFINCNFDLAQFESCQNIILENCTFNKLVLCKCKRFKINKSFITDLSFKKTKEVSFKTSIIFNTSTKVRNRKIVFKDCQINNNFLDFILKKSRTGLYSKTKEIVTAIITILSFSIFYRFFFIRYLLISSEIVNILLCIGVILTLLLFLLFTLFYESVVKRKNPKIKILNNK